MSLFSFSGDLRSPSDSSYMDYPEPTHDLPYDDERLDELRHRINSGYYSQREVLHTVSTRLVSDWMGEDDT